MNPIPIISARRTPIGAFLGALADVPATELGSIAIRAAVQDAMLTGSQIDEALLGMVLAAGVGQAPARQAVIGAGLPTSVPCTTIGKVCGSGMKAIIDATRSISADGISIALAGGMESMSRAPHMVAGLRRGRRMGDEPLIDHMAHDGLVDAYDKGASMGQFAELCADRYRFSRAEQDAWAIQSLERSLAAQSRGAFTKEIAPVTLNGPKGAVTITVDEQPGRARPDRIPLLKPAFKPEGTVTAASSSSISDGAAALILASQEASRAHGLTVRARIVGAASHAQEPAWFTTAPVAAATKLLEQLGWQASEVDLWEVNEAFAVVAMAFVRDLGLSEARVNVNGGACALGHPIGASGARIVVTLLHAMEERGARRGIAAICIGGGEALALALERS